MPRFLHVVPTAISVVADVRYLLVLIGLIVLLPQLEVIQVLIVLVVDDVVRVLLRQLKNHLILLSQVVVVWVHKHELTVVRHVVVLLGNQVLVSEVQRNRVLLDYELWVLMNQEWLQVVVLPLGRVIWILQVLNILQLYLIVSREYVWLRVVAQVVRAMENMRTKGVDSDEGVVEAFGTDVLGMCDVLDGLVQVLHLAAILLDGRVRVRHAEHLEALCLIRLLVRQFVLLAKDELLVQELGQSQLLTALFVNVLSLLPELFGEDGVVTNVILLGHLDLVLGDLLLAAFDDIIHLKLQPPLGSLIENDAVAEVQGAHVERAVLVVHPTVVDQELLLALSVVAVVVELDGLNEFCVVVSVDFVRLNHRHVALLRLNDVHRQVLQVLLFISRFKETPYFYCLQVVAVGVFRLEVISRQITVSSSRVLNDFASRTQIVLMVLDLDALGGVVRSLNVADEFGTLLNDVLLGRPI